MHDIEENGYISNYLIHWTGRDDRGNIDDAKGAETLSIIASTCELRLSYNCIHPFDVHHEIHDKMCCFTDVPLTHSAEHCIRYGRFAIAFHKLRLMGVGAQPVFYATPAFKKDLDCIFSFLQREVKLRTIDENVLRSFLNHFYYMKEFSDGKADRTDSYYYEREWRLGSMTLPTMEEWDRDNPMSQCRKEGYTTSPYIGKRVIRDGEEYFSFSEDDVAFIITPAEFSSKIDNPYGFHIEHIEKYIRQNT